MARNNPETAQVDVHITTEEAKKQIKELSQRMEELAVVINKASGAGKEERAKAKEEYAQLKAEVKQYQDVLSKRVDIIINGEVAGASINELAGASKKLFAELKKLPEGSDEFIAKAQLYNKIQTKLDEVKASAKGVNEELNKKVELVLTGNLTNATLEELRAASKRLKDELEKLPGETEEFANKSKLLLQVDQRIEALTAKTKGLVSQFDKRVELVLKGDLAHATMEELDAAAKKLWADLQRLGPGTQEFVDKTKQFQQVEDRLKSLQTEVKGTGGIWNSLTDSVKQFGTLALGYLGFQAITGQIQNIIQKNAQLSDSLADVRLTTGLTEQQVNDLNKAFGKFDTRTSRQELLEIAKIAGQFGVAKDQLLGFTEAVNKTTVVLKSEFKGGAEEITTTLAGLRNVLTDIKTDKIDDDLLKIGNGLIVLAQEGVATAPVVSDFANRIGGIGISLGLTSDQVLGFGATLQELNVSTERGGTAIGKILQKMTQNTEEFAKVAGYDGSAGKSLRDFEQLVNTDIYSAFLKFVEGSKKGGDSAIAFAGILKDSEIAGAGASEVVSKLSNNLPLLQQRVKLAGEAIQSTGAITEQYAIKNDNFAAQLEKLGKRIGSIFANTTSTTFFKDIVAGLNDMLATTPKFEQLNEEWKRLSDSSRNLETNIVPLLGRYDELKSKTSLSKDEQAELKAIIEKVGTAIPTAISAVDAYGNALGISTTKAKEFVDAQRKLTEFKNQDAIKESEQQLKSYESNIRTLSETLTKMISTGKKVVFNETRQVDEEIIATGEDISNLQNALKELGTNADGLKLKIRELKGQPLIEDAPVGPFLPKEFENSTEELKRRLSQLRVELKQTTEGTAAYEKTLTDIASIEDKIANKKSKKTYTDEEKQQATQIANEKLQIEEEFYSKLTELQKQRRKLEVSLIQDTQQKEIAQLQLKHDEDIAAVDKTVEDEQKKLDAGFKKKLISEQSYAEKTAELNRQSSDNRLQIEAAFESEKEKLIEKFYKENDKKEYDLAVTNLAKWHATEKTANEKSFQDGNISKDQFRKKDKQLETDYYASLIDIAKDYGLDASAVEKLLADAKAKIREQDLLDAKTKSLAALEDEIVLAVRGSNQELEARKAYLKEKAKAEMDAAQENADQQKLIWDQLQQDLKDMDAQFLQEKISQYEQGLNQIAGIINLFNSSQDSRDTKELAKDKKINDQKKVELKKKLDSDVLTQQQYDEKIAALDEDTRKKEAEVKRKAWDRQHQADLIQATINTALAISKALAGGPPPFNLALAAISAAAEAIQTGIIAGQSPPEFEEGRKPITGIVKGPTHDDGGIKLVDSVTGETKGIMQGNEGIFSVPMYVNNPELIDAIFDAEGKKITPADVPGFVASDKTPQYETGKAIIENTLTKQEISSLKEISVSVLDQKTRETRDASLKELHEYKEQLITEIKNPLLSDQKGIVRVTPGAGREINTTSTIQNELVRLQEIINSSAVDKTQKVIASDALLKLQKVIASDEALKIQKVIASDEILRIQQVLANSPISVDQKVIASDAIARIQKVIASKDETVIDRVTHALNSFTEKVAEVSEQRLTAKKIDATKTSESIAKEIISETVTERRQHVPIVISARETSPQNETVNETTPVERRQHVPIVISARELISQEEKESLEIKATSVLTAENFLERQAALTEYRNYSNKIYETHRERLFIENALNDTLHENNIQRISSQEETIKRIEEIKTLKTNLVSANEIVTQVSAEKLNSVQKEIFREKLSGAISDFDDGFISKNIFDQVKSTLKEQLSTQSLSRSVNELSKFETKNSIQSSNVSELNIQSLLSSGLLNGIAPEKLISVEPPQLNTEKIIQSSKVDNISGTISILKELGIIKNELASPVADVKVNDSAETTKRLAEAIEKIHATHEEITATLSTIQKKGVKGVWEHRSWEEGKNDVDIIKDLARFGR